MDRIASAVILLTFALGGAAFAVSTDLQIDGRFNVKGISTFEANVRAPSVTIEAGFFKGDGSQLTNLPVTIETKSVAFIYPFATAEAYLRLPYNITATSVEVYCLAGASVTGAIDYGSTPTNLANITAVAAGTWKGSPVNVDIGANSNLRFYIPTVSGTVKGATITFHYRRR